MERKNVVIIIVVAIIGVLLTVGISKGEVRANSSEPTFKQEDNKVINESIVEDEKYENFLYEGLLEYKQSKIKENFQAQVKIDSLEKQIRAYLGNNVDKCGIVYYDINSKKSIEINGNKQFKAASTIKVPINMLMFDMIQSGKININEKLKYEECDYEDGAGVLQGSELSSPIPIQTLSKYSLVYSDNIAVNMLLRKVGNENRYNYIEKIVGHPIAHKENDTTPKDSFKILKRLYLNPQENTYYNTIIETMKNTEYHDRIDKYIPHSIVAHKIGDFDEYANDMGIVYTENPYILVVLTQEVPDAYEIIAQVSKIIYEAQQKSN